ncbi:replication-associated recombination protein A [Alicyclobacillus sp. SO9]|uniref:replication-associated recombination protein A n=1 Tax=Alicyclobacillus sp. SO9 TaxID=2665646 RepID=UPI0018E8B884|nr:replication-associated recombination protein A [Alicyclobacillus sp. SO9]QQE77375.1 replication-associated recombination protein A [Alicyclobacillus sp. SO9]
MDLFSYQAQREAEETAPLAYRMRPQSLDELVGQEDVVGPGTMLRRVIETDRLVSLIFWGPPGTGKTSLAKVIANLTKARFEVINAVTSGVADIRKAVEESREAQAMYSRKTIVFIDEIHRFNKMQQDALLPHVEAGLITLIGATTENPYTSVNNALLSRSHIFRLRHISVDGIRSLLHRALADEERGLGKLHVRLSEEAENWLIQMSGGDARRSLNALEMVALSAPVGADGGVDVSLEQVQSILQQKQVLYDKSGDEHYDTISAFIKSVRGSNPDAAMFWLAKMIAGGEDPKFIARRLIILASEDIGMADPQGLSIAVAAYHAIEAIGMPEGRIPLAEATAYLASTAKSNRAYTAINKALEDVESGVSLSVPLHLRGTGYSGAARLGHGEGYLYPHDYPGHYVEQSYWPQDLEPRHYYTEESKDKGESQG